MSFQPNIRIAISWQPVTFLQFVFMSHHSLYLFRIEKLSLNILSQVDFIKPSLQHFCMHFNRTKSPKDSLDDLMTSILIIFLPTSSHYTLILPILLILPTWIITWNILISDLGDILTTKSLVTKPITEIILTKATVKANLINKTVYPLIYPGNQLIINWKYFSICPSKKVLIQVLMTTPKK